LENINRKKNEKHFHHHQSGQRGSSVQIFSSQHLTWRVCGLYVPVRLHDGVLLYVIVAALSVALPATNQLMALPGDRQFFGHG
jgi:hypothetical protein